MEIRLNAPFDKERFRSLRAGDNVLISGEIYTARDAAHKRLNDMIENGETLPIPLMGQIIYYTGPTPSRPGKPVGALGPTTSGRMDVFTPRLIREGLMGMIGKGKRSEAVKEAIKNHGSVYFGAIGGAGALLAQCVRAREVVAFAELQSEAIARLVVVDFPCVVIVDSLGNDLYVSGPRDYCEAKKNA